MSVQTRRRRGVIATSSWLAIGLALAGGEAALAQQASTDSTVADVVVTGTRASLQSAINRKRAAATNVDSIVAEDIGQFPDKNVGDALQRVTGVSLTRDFGEGEKVSIRGVESDLNRIEINGLTVLGDAETGARSGNLQELAAELVSSIDVFKGFTADMTEGGVGGTVSIRTRRPLDLRKPIFVLTGSGQYLDLTDNITFRGNLTAGRTFWEDRFGVILNVTYNDNESRTDFLRNTTWTSIAASEPARNAVTGAWLGQVASGDYDNSDEKTYVDQNFAGITRKQDCPVLAAGTANPCLNQWNEHISFLPRYGIWERFDKRTSGQVTLEYRVSDNLRTFVEFTLNDRDAKYTDSNFAVEASAAQRINAVTYDRFGQPVTRFTGAPVGPGVPTAIPGTTQIFPYPNPQPVIVDADHNLIDWFTAPYANTPTAGLSANQGSAASFSVNEQSFGFLQRSQYLQAGFNWKSDSLNIDGVIATSEGKNIDDSNVMTYRANIPNIHVSLNPDNGVPSFEFPTGFDPNDPATYTVFARDAAGNPVTTNNISASWQPKETELTEDTAKLDVDWFVDGFINKVEVGYQGRKAATQRYIPNGYTTFDPADPTRAAIYVQSARVDNNVNLVPGLVADTTPIYNFNNPPITTGLVSTTQNVTQATALAFIQALNSRSANVFYNGGPDQGVDLPSSWFIPDIDRIMDQSLIDTSMWNRDCIRRCVGRNAAGQILGEFDQSPSLDTEETIHAVYGQVSFQGDFYGMTLKGNGGVRVIQSEVHATGAISEQLRPASGPLTPGRTRVTSIDRKYTDALPTFNVSLDITDKLVARFGYAKLLARPKIADIVPNGTCIFNDLTTGTGFTADDSCNIGNPGLNPYRASSYDVSVGYYWNPDTLVNVAVFYKQLDTFTLGRQLIENVDVFGDGRGVDVTMPVNGQGATQKGLELTAQTAFTWLPAPFDGLGVQANYTYATADDVGLFDTLTGEEIPQAGLSRDTYNLVLYYDKGPINARIAYNSRSEYFTGGGTAGRAGRNAATEYVDGKVTYELSEHLSVFAEAQNLTGEQENGYAGSIRTNNMGYSGKRFFLGATYRY